jgi:hypothetical protein
MFYEQDILEGLTKKTFYDSTRIVLTDLEKKFIGEDEHESRLFIVYTHVDTTLKCVTRPLCEPQGSGSSLSFHYGGSGGSDAVFCEDQRRSKCSPGIPDNLILPECLGGEWGKK